MTTDIALALLAAVDAGELNCSLRGIEVRAASLVRFELACVLHARSRSSVPF